MIAAFWFTAISLFWISFTLSLLFGALATKSGVMDAPDGGRKQQDQPVARLGGVAIALSALLVAGGVTILSGSFSVVATSPTGLVLSFTCIAFLMGLWDDVWTAGAWLKLIILMSAAIGCAALGLQPLLLSSPFGAVKVPAILIAGSALWLLVMTNAANFMDGSNGLSIGCLGIMLIGLAFAASNIGDISLEPWWFALFGAIGGFLVHNLRGTLYAGDAGALGLGALFASLGLISGLEVWTVATFALPFLIDVVLTLVWRARHGKSWLKAHRDHAYQRLMDEGWGHLDVAILYWGLSAVCAVGAVIAAEAGGWIPFTLFWVLLVAGTVLWGLNRSAARLDQTP